jgi:hypothetical protein
LDSRSEMLLSLISTYSSLVPMLAQAGPIRLRLAGKKEGKAAVRFFLAEQIIGQGAGHDKGEEEEGAEGKGPDQLALGFEVHEEKRRRRGCDRGDDQRQRSKQNQSAFRFILKMASGMACQEGRLPARAFQLLVFRAERKNGMPASCRTTEKPTRRGSETL